MKNNIDNSLITNRKIIIELRFQPAPKFLDLKGTILDKINTLNIIKAADWSIGDSALKIADNNKEELIRNHIQVEINRLSIISTKVDSIEKFVDDFRWFSQVSYFVAIFVIGGQENASKSPTFLSCDTLGTI